MNQWKKTKRTKESRQLCCSCFQGKTEFVHIDTVIKENCFAAPFPFKSQDLYQKEHTR